MPANVAGAAGLRDGGSPCSLQRLPQALAGAAAGEVELGVGAREVYLDGLEADVELLRDLGVAAALAGEAGDAALARPQRVDARAHEPPRPRAGGAQLLERALGDAVGAAAVRDLHP